MWNNNKFSNKMRSETGASLSIALLLFIVCAAIGAVVLTAGTAAGGRASRLAELDQRYYSVASAADLLAKELNNQKVTIVRKKVETKTTTTGYTISSGADGSVSVTASAPSSGNPVYEYETRINNFVVADQNQRIQPGDDMGFLTIRAIMKMFGSFNCNTEDAMAFSFTDNNTESNKPFSMTHSGNGMSYLDITGGYAVKSDGTLLLTLKDSLQGTDHYALTLTLGADIDETESKSTSSSSTTTNTGNGYNQTDTITTTTIKTSTIKWTANSIEKGMNSLTDIAAVSGGGTSD